MSDPNIQTTPIDAALSTIAAKGDVLDIVAPRIRRTEHLGTRAMLMAGVPTALEVFDSAYIGAEYALTAPTYVGIGAAAATGLYAKNRLTEGRRLTKAQEVQEVIRAELGETVDVFRVGRRGNRELALRWYDLDDGYRESGRPVNESVAAWRYRRVVDFAKSHGIDRVITSDIILKNITDKAGDYGTVTEREKLFAGHQGKTVKVVDTKADAKLLTSRIQQAEALAEDLTAPEDTDAIDLLAKRLIHHDYQHPITGPYTDWIASKRSPILYKKLVDTLKQQLADTFSGLGESTRVPMIEKHSSLSPATTLGDQKGDKKVVVNTRPTTAIIDIAALSSKKATTKTAGGSYDPRFLTDRARVTSVAQVSGKGVNLLTTTKGISGYSTPTTQHGSRSFADVTGYPDIHKFVESLLARPDSIKDEPPECDPIQPSDVWKNEFAILALLEQKDPVKMRELAIAHRAAANSTRSQSFLQRVPDELPRTLVFGRKYGHGASKAEHTIEYRRTPVRSRARKLAAVALAMGIGVGMAAGASAGERYFDAQLDVDCNVVFEENRGKTQAEVNHAFETCADDIQKAKDDHFYLSKTKVIHGAHDTLENETLLKLYREGLLTDEILKRAYGSISQEWAEQKRKDLMQYSNAFQRSDRAMIAIEGDNTEANVKNPVVWNITNQTGNPIGGFWNTDSFNKLTITESSALGAVLPYMNANMSLDNRDSYSYKDGKFYIDNYGDALQEIRTVPVTDMSTVTTESKVVIAEGQVDGFNFSDQVHKQQTENSKVLAYIMYSLPVLEGADVVAINVTKYRYNSEEPIETLTPTVIQLPGGGFKFLIPRETNNEGYLKIRYAVDPASTKDQPLTTTGPMVAQQPGESYRPIDHILNDTDIATLRAKIPVNADASATKVAAAISTTRTYDYSPYTFNEGSEIFNFTNDASGTPTREGLIKITGSAIDMDEANCSIAGMMGIVLTRGKDDGQDLNFALGWKDGDGDGKITRNEAHTGIRRTDGLFIDGTPARAKDKYKPSATAEKDLGASPADTAITSAKAIAGFAGGILVGKYSFDGGVAYARRRRRILRDKAQQALALTLETPEERRQLQGDIAILNQMQYGKPGSRIDEQTVRAAIAEQYDAATDAQLQRRIANLAGQKPKDVKTLVLQRQHDGSVTIDDATRQRLVKLIQAANRLGA